MSTVRGLMESASAISRLERPSTARPTRPRTSISHGVGPWGDRSGAVLGAGGGCVASAAAVGSTAGSVRPPGHAAAWPASPSADLAQQGGDRRHLVLLAHRQGQRGRQGAGRMGGGASGMGRLGAAEMSGRGITQPSGGLSFTSSPTLVRRHPAERPRCIGATAEAESGHGWRWAD
ncbi:MAG: hypothetical protein AVDCRST_MAG49-227 [uncultured Thermomicrobiales bacterium]|uniref:Uncharacterized protein n=1 Tax=uncultured Thermomicrobiales bacterium TaxID=1645740 RepID=A0A6J4TZI2_9BACT|nr:MAG: hypothetical protein AVDCRST_MAG49-227 [uncultured Thermomicrobiales bacterium]